MNATTITDRHQNTVSVSEGKVFLHTYSGNTIMLGKLYRDAGRLCINTVRLSSKHLYRKLNAYGINVEVLLELGVEFVKIVSDHVDVYLLPIEVIKAEAVKDKLFRHEGFELQRYLTMTLLERYKVK